MTSPQTATTSTIVCIPGRDDTDEATWFIVKGAWSSGAYPTYEAARQAMHWAHHDTATCAVCA